MKDPAAGRTKVAEPEAGCAPVQLPEAAQLLALVDDHVSVALSPAICEEALFRGFILSGLRSLGQWPAIVISSLLFAVAHGSVYRMLPTLFLGLLLGYAVWKTGSLLAGVVIHAITNGIAVWLAKSGGADLDSLAGRQFLPVSWALAGLALMLVGLWMVSRSPSPAEGER